MVLPPPDELLELEELELLLLDELELLLDELLELEDELELLDELEDEELLELDELEDDELELDELLELDEEPPLYDTISNQSSRISLCPTSPSTTKLMPLCELLRLKHTVCSWALVPLKLTPPTLLPLPTATRTVAALLLSEAPLTLIE
jgi:hypothetical protein